MKILVINAGSSSLKYQLFDMQNGDVLAKGLCECIGDTMGSVTHKRGDEKYVKEVNAYSGYIDSIDGYPVEYFTEGSKYTSTVEISLGNSLKDSKTYEMEQQSFLQKLIAKIVWFFKQIFAAGIF